MSKSHYVLFPTISNHNRQIYQITKFRDFIFSKFLSQSTVFISFQAMVPFFIPWKHQKTSGFLVLLGGNERKHLPEIG